TLSTVTSGAIALSAGAATQIALNAGNNQTVAAGSAVPIRPSVIVRDGSGNPVAGVAVTFAVAPGNGTITGPNQTTNATGIAAVGRWTLGKPAGTHTLTATSTGLNGSPVTFTATGTAGAPTSIAVSAGNNQSAAVGTAVTTPPAVIVQDQFNNPVASVAVTFAPAAGSGTVNPTTPVTTGPGGLAAVSSCTLGGTPTVTTNTSGTAVFTNLSITGTAGPHTLGFSAPQPFTGVTSGTVSLTAGAATQIAMNAGNGQTATTGTAVAVPPSVIVRDASNNPVAGVAVTFVPGTGSGSVTGANPATDATGIAAAGRWLLGHP